MNGKLAARVISSAVINLCASCRLTKKAEPPPTRDVNRDSGTDSANGGWLRRLVRRHHNVGGTPSTTLDEFVETSTVFSVPFVL
jgi:hypothetical protein